MGEDNREMPWPVVGYRLAKEIQPGDVLLLSPTWRFQVQRIERMRRTNGHDADPLSRYPASWTVDMGSEPLYDFKGFTVGDGPVMGGIIRHEYEWLSVEMPALSAYWFCPEHGLLLTVAGSEIPGARHTPGAPEGEGTYSCNECRRPCTLVRSSQSLDLTRFTPDPRGKIRT